MYLANYLPVTSLWLIHFPPLPYFLKHSLHTTKKQRSVHSFVFQCRSVTSLECTHYNTYIRGKYYIVAGTSYSCLILGKVLKLKPQASSFRGHNILLNKRFHYQAWLVLGSLVKSHAYLSILFTLMTEYHCNDWISHSMNILFCLYISWIFLYILTILKSAALKTGEKLLFEDFSSFSDIHVSQIISYNNSL